MSVPLILHRRTARRGGLPVSRSKSECFFNTPQGQGRSSIGGMTYH